MLTSLLANTSDEAQGHQSTRHYVEGSEFGTLNRDFRRTVINATDDYSPQGRPPMVDPDPAPTVESSIKSRALSSFTMDQA